MFFLLLLGLSVSPPTSTASEQHMILVFIRNVYSEDGMVPIEVASDSNISELRRIYTEYTRTDDMMHDFQFTFHGVVLEDSALLADSGISSQSIVDVQSPTEDLSGLEGLPPIRPLFGPDWIYRDLNQTKAINTVMEFLRECKDRDAAAWLIESDLWILKEGSRPKYSFVLSGIPNFGQGLHLIDNRLYKRRQERIDFDQGVIRIFTVEPGVPLREILTFLANYR